MYVAFFDHSVFSHVWVNGKLEMFCAYGIITHLTSTNTIQPIAGYYHVMIVLWSCISAIIWQEISQDMLSLWWLLMCHCMTGGHTICCHYGDLKYVLIRCHYGDLCAILWQEVIYDMLSLWWLMRYYMTRSHLRYVVTMVTCALLYDMRSFKIWWLIMYHLWKLYLYGTVIIVLGGKPYTG